MGLSGARGSGGASEVSSHIHSTPASQGAMLTTMPAQPAGTTFGAGSTGSALGAGSTGITGSTGGADIIGSSADVSGSTFRSDRGAETTAKGPGVVSSVIQKGKEVLGLDRKGTSSSSGGVGDREGARELPDVSARGVATMGFDQDARRVVDTATPTPETLVGPTETTLPHVSALEGVPPAGTGSYSALGGATGATAGQGGGADLMVGSGVGSGGVHATRELERGSEGTEGRGIIGAAAGAAAGAASGAAGVVGGLVQRGKEVMGLDSSSREGDREGVSGGAATLGFDQDVRRAVDTAMPTPDTLVAPTEATLPHVSALDSAPPAGTGSYSAVGGGAFDATAAGGEGTMLPAGSGRGGADLMVGSGVGSGGVHATRELERGSEGTEGRGIIGAAAGAAAGAASGAAGVVGGLVQKGKEVMGLDSSSREGDVTTVGFDQDVRREVDTAMLTPDTLVAPTEATLPHVSALDSVPPAGTGSYSAVGGGAFGATAAGGAAMLPAASAGAADIMVGSGAATQRAGSVSQRVQEFSSSQQLQQQQQQREVVSEVERPGSRGAVSTGRSGGGLIASIKGMLMGNQATQEVPAVGREATQEVSLGVVGACWLGSWCE